MPPLNFSDEEMDLLVALAAPIDQHSWPEFICRERERAGVIPPFRRPKPVSRHMFPTSTDPNRVPANFLNISCSVLSRGQGGDYRRIMLKVAVTPNPRGRWSRLCRGRSPNQFGPGSMFGRFIIVGPVFGGDARRFDG
jgi:hypothetical protein